MGHVNHEGDIRAYRIHWTTNRRWWHPHRPWQAESESESCRFARRGLTPRAAERKMRRDERRNGATLWQRYRTQRKVIHARLCTYIGHRPNRTLVGPWPRVSSTSKWCGRCLTDLPE